MFQNQLNTHDKNEPQKIVDLYPDRKAINSIWVLKIKYAPENSIERYKNRLIFVGYHQAEGIEYNASFVPVVGYEPVCVLLLVAGQFINDHHFDIDRPFLNGIFDEQVSMEKPLGFSKK